MIESELHYLINRHIGIVGDGEEDARVDAWRALASYPAPTIAVMAEKAAFCGADETRECDGCHDLLINSLTADARRFAAEA